MQAPVITPVKNPVASALPEDIQHAAPHAPRQGEYLMGHSDVLLKLLNRRTAAHNAAHLLPRLRPGMNVLNLGCGPGSITLGLAQAVCPGGSPGWTGNGSRWRWQGGPPPAPGRRTPSSSPETPWTCPSPPGPWTPSTATGS